MNSDAEKLRYFEKVVDLAHKNGFYVITNADSIMLKRDDWHAINLNTIEETYHFLNGFEIGRRTGKKEAANGTE